MYVKALYNKAYQAEHRERIKEHRATYRSTPRGRAAHMLDNARRRAKDCGLSCTITREWIQERLEAGVCEATGLTLYMDPAPAGMSRHPDGPSLDRLDPKEGYTPANTRVTTWHYNTARNEYGDAALLRLCEAIIRKERK